MQRRQGRQVAHRQGVDQAGVAPVRRDLDEADLLDVVVEAVGLAVEGEGAAAGEGGDEALQLLRCPDPRRHARSISGPTWVKLAGVHTSPLFLQVARRPALGRPGRRAAILMFLPVPTIPTVARPPDRPGGEPRDRPPGASRAPRGAPRPARRAAGRHVRLRGVSSSRRRPRSRWWRLSTSARASPFSIREYVRGPTWLPWRRRTASFSTRHLRRSCRTCTPASAPGRVLSSW